MSDRSQEDYAAALAQALPPGPFWAGFRSPDGDGRALLRAKALSFVRVDERAAEVLAESVPTAADKTLAVREVEAGLPDPCTVAFDTIPERRAAVVARWLDRGGHALAYFVEVIERLGYEAEIEEFRPFACGVSVCGGDILGPAEERFVWRVRVLGPRLTEFVCGEAVCGDHLGVFRRAEDLECLLARIHPAGTTAIVTYEGA